MHDLDLKQLLHQADASPVHRQADLGLQEAVEGQEEPERPAPSFVTTAADAEDAGHHAAPSPSATVAASAAPAAASASNDGGSTAGWFGLGAGLIGLGAGVTALGRTRPSKG